MESNDRESPPPVSSADPGSEVNTMVWPLRVSTCKRILPDAPGLFGTKRRHDLHTGVDLYCELGTVVQAMSDGTVIGVERFTGEWCPGEDSTPWWNNTSAILVRHEMPGDVASKGTVRECVIVYGEVDPQSVLVSVGDVVERGQALGAVNVSVLRSFKGRPMVMLHLEVYDAVREPDAHGTRTVWWPLKDADRVPDHLCDPEPLLRPLATAPDFQLCTYDGVSFVDASAPRKNSPYWKVWGGSV